MVIESSVDAPKIDYPLHVGENCVVSRTIFPSCGPVAQLGARFHGMEEVVGSIPTRSTIFNGLH
jgi:hypothetical protein